MEGVTPVSKNHKSLNIEINKKIIKAKDKSWNLKVKRYFIYSASSKTARHLHEVYARYKHLLVNMATKIPAIQDLTM